MLARLRMSIPEVLEAYESLAEPVFGRGFAPKIAGAFKDGALYDCMALEKAIKDIVEKKLGDSEALLADDSPSACKV